jgi:hypothetical protein
MVRGRVLCRAFHGEKVFATFKLNITQSLKRILKQHAIDLNGFELNRYHHYVQTDELHYKVVSQTRDLFSADLHFNVEKMINHLSQMTGLALTNVMASTGKKLHIKKWSPFFGQRP